MMIDHPTPPAPAPFDLEKEAKQQTEYLRAINSKLGFIVFIILAVIAIQVFAALIGL